MPGRAGARVTDETAEWADFLLGETLMYFMNQLVDSQTSSRMTDMQLSSFICHRPINPRTRFPGPSSITTENRGTATTDLAGFWERLYPQVRRELMRRYPKHQWPEKP